MDKRWLQIQSLWQSTPALYVITGFFAGLLFFPAIDALNQNASAFLSGFVPEAVGIGFTVLFIDRLYQRREHNREEWETKTRLVREVRSPANIIAKHAVHQIREFGWLTNVSQEPLLRNQKLTQANLQGANLENANLEQVDFWRTNLEGANLTGANLQNAFLNETNLTGANLVNANLQGTLLGTLRGVGAAILRGTNLRGANLEMADLNETNLENANLSNANLTNAVLFSANCRFTVFDHAILVNADLGIANLSGANLRQADMRGARLNTQKFDKTTILPDGTNWTAKADMTRFTDPNHPDFWQPGRIAMQKTGD